MALPGQNTTSPGNLLTKLLVCHDSFFPELWFAAGQNNRPGAKVQKKPGFCAM
jgi:hypothetical protein